MKIGIPTEIKILEGRVALVPEAVKELVKLNHQVFIQQGAGKLSGYNDQAYQIAGATIVKNAETLYGESGLIVKVKEPLPAEFDFLRQDHILFSYLHLAAELNLMKHLLAVGITAIAFETVEVNGALPLLTPMSDIAGRLSIQIGTHLLHAPQGGKGILLGGLPAAKRGNVVVLGAGVAGGNAASVAAALGSNVTVFDKKHDKLTEMRMLGPNVTALHPYSQSIEEAVQQADLLIGAVLIPGAPAPVLVTKEMVSTMEPGSVIIDIAVDQGGCIETIHSTTYQQPTYLQQEVIHFGVANMPGAVPYTASQVLSSVIMPFVAEIADNQWKNNPALVSGVNVADGEVKHSGLDGLV